MRSASAPLLGQPPTEGGESHRSKGEESQRAPGVGDVMNDPRFIGGGLITRHLCALIPPATGKTGCSDEGDKYGFIHVCFFLIAVKQPFLTYRAVKSFSFWLRRSCEDSWIHNHLLQCRWCSEFQ